MKQLELPLSNLHFQKSSDERKADILDLIDHYTCLSFRDVAILLRLSKTRARGLMLELCEDGYIELYGSVPSGNPYAETKLFCRASSYIQFDIDETVFTTNGGKNE